VRVKDTSLYYGPDHDQRNPSSAEKKRKEKKVGDPEEAYSSTRIVKRGTRHPSILETSTTKERKVRKYMSQRKITLHKSRQKKDEVGEKYSGGRISRNQDFSLRELRRGDKRQNRKKGAM